MVQNLIGFLPMFEVYFNEKNEFSEKGIPTQTILFMQ